MAEEKKVDLNTDFIAERDPANMDELERFEAKLPFDNIMICGFFEIVQRCEERNGIKRLNYVMYDKFRRIIS